MRGAGEGTGMPLMVDFPQHFLGSHPATARYLLGNICNLDGKELFMAAFLANHTNCEK